LFWSISREIFDFVEIEGIGIPAPDRPHNPGNDRAQSPTRQFKFGLIIRSLRKRTQAIDPLPDKSTALKTCQVPTAANSLDFNNIHLPINCLQFGTMEVGSITDTLAT
jgi:hypothetical protein